MSEHSPVPQSHARAVRLWLVAVAAMIFLTLIVGGATRLTESGLSIVEWKPITGVVPPLTQGSWQAEFDGYKAIPQYRELNRGMTLDEFKTIYWWEWTHRLLARSTGAVFLLPFLFFLWRGAIPPPLRTRLWVIFAGGAGLGVVGWWMVSSGLSGTLTSVSQYRLAFHLTLACIIYAAVVWTADRMTERGAHDPLHEQACPATGRAVTLSLRVGAGALLAVAICQIYLGALVAGVFDIFTPLRFLALVVLIVMVSFAFMAMMSCLVARMNNPMLPRAMFGILNTLLYFPSGAIYPIQSLPSWLRWITRVDPFTYAVHALKSLLLKNTGFAAIGFDLFYLAVFSVLAMIAATLLFKRTLS